MIQKLVDVDGIHGRAKTYLIRSKIWGNIKHDGNGWNDCHSITSVNDRSVIQEFHQNKGIQSQRRIIDWSIIKLRIQRKQKIANKISVEVLELPQCRFQIRIGLEMKSVRRR